MHSPFFDVNTRYAVPTIFSSKPENLNIMRNALTTIIDKANKKLYIFMPMTRETTTSNKQNLQLKMLVLCYPSRRKKQKLPRKQ